MPVEYRVLRGLEVNQALEALARLRTTVFQEWPYLYDGDPANERDYLKGYAVEGAILVLANKDGATVGAATAMPLTSHGDAAQMSLPPDAPNEAEIFYCAESVLLADHRGQGIGHQFFDLREAEAKAQGYGWCGFAGIVRPDDHPKRPDNARSHSAFWEGRGYRPLDGAIAEFSWTDIGDAQPSSKPLQFWIRRL